jgi:hypothetical protein
MIRRVDRSLVEPFNLLKNVGNVVGHGTVSYIEIEDTYDG